MHADNTIEIIKFLCPLSSVTSSHLQLLELVASKHPPAHDFVCVARALLKLTLCVRVLIRGQYITSYSLVKWRTELSVAQYYLHSGNLRLQMIVTDVIAV